MSVKNGPWTTCKIVCVIILLLFLLASNKHHIFLLEVQRWSAYLLYLKSVALDGGWHLIDVLPDLHIFWREYRYIKKNENQSRSLFLKWDDITYSCSVCANVHIDSKMCFELSNVIRCAIWYHLYNL